MSVLGDLAGELVGAWIGAFLFLTGEVLRKGVTLGSHRIRWWEVQDGNIAWPTTLLGAGFWFGVGALLFLLL